VLLPVLAHQTGWDLFAQAPQAFAQQQEQQQQQWVACPLPHSWLLAAARLVVDELAGCQQQLAAAEQVVVAGRAGWQILVCGSLQSALLLCCHLLCLDAVLQ
jgi:hypothetical protein